MNILLQRRFVIRENFVMMIGVALCFYFSYHAIQGNRSLISLMNLNGAIAVQTQEYSEIKAQREKLESKVIAMRPGSLSRDLLEERVRAALGYRSPDEVTLLKK